MSAYTTALFLHLLGVVTLFVGIAFQLRAASALRRASTVGEVRLWMRVLGPTGRMLPAAVLVLVVSGLYVTSRWSLRPWIATALVAVLAMAALGATVLRRHYQAIGRTAGGAGEGPVTADLALLLRAPGAWVVLSAINGAALGVLWLMTNKPGWGASVGVVLAAAAAGGVLGAAGIRRRGGRPAPWKPGQQVPR